MKKIFLLFFFLCTFAFGAFLPAGSAAFSSDIPPTIIITRPPKAVVIPGTRYVYFLPDYDEDILFYHGFWYRPYSGVWYRSKGYNGPWNQVRKVPGQVLNLPADFRGIGQAGEKIPYRSLKKHWRDWEASGYWEEGARKARQKKAAKKTPKPKPADKVKEPSGVAPGKSLPGEAPKEEPEKGTGQGIDGAANPDETGVKETPK